MVPSQRTRALPTLVGLALALGFLAGPGSLSAQQPVPTPLDVQPAPDSIQAMMSEYQEKAQRYGQIQTEAFMSSQEMQTRQAAISDLVVEALYESHPQAEAQIARLDAIEAEAFEAQQAQDMDRLGQLIQEAGDLQGQLQAAQDLVLEREDVKAQIDSFEADLMVLMLAIDPEAQELRTRLDELADILSSAGPGGD